MAASPDVHIEWARFKEVEGLEQPVLTPIRNMSLMTFGRQMYLVKESSSLAGLKPHQPGQDDDDGGDNSSEQHENIDYNNNNKRLTAESQTTTRERRSARVNEREDDEEEEEVVKRTSTLYIMNTMEKDKGIYFCNGSNAAGNVSASITLTVLQRVQVTAAAYSGEEVAGIVLGALFLCLVTFMTICTIVLKSKSHRLVERSNRNGTHTPNGSATLCGQPSTCPGKTSAPPPPPQQHPQALVIDSSNGSTHTTTTATNHLCLMNGSLPSHNRAGSDLDNTRMSNLLLTLDEAEGRHDMSSVTGQATRDVTLTNVRDNRMEQFELYNFRPTAISAEMINYACMPMDKTCSAGDGGGGTHLDSMLINHDDRYDLHTYYALANNLATQATTLHHPDGYGNSTSLYSYPLDDLHEAQDNNNISFLPASRVDACQRYFPSCQQAMSLAHVNGHGHNSAAAAAAQPSLSNRLKSSSPSPSPSCIVYASTAHCADINNWNGSSSCKQVALAQPSSSASKRVCMDNVSKRLMTSVASSPPSSSSSCLPTSTPPPQSDKTLSSSHSNESSLINAMGGVNRASQSSLVVDELKKRLACKDVKRNTSNCAASASASSSTSSSSSCSSSREMTAGAPPPPMVRFSDSLAVCSYSPRANVVWHKIVVQHSHNHGRHALTGMPANVLHTRDSPDEGLGEEAE